MLELADLNFLAFELLLIRYFAPRNFDHSYICFRFKFLSTSLCS